MFSLLSIEDLNKLTRYASLGAIFVIIIVHKFSLVISQLFSKGTTTLELFGVFVNGQTSST